MRYPRRAKLQFRRSQRRRYLRRPSAGATPRVEVFWNTADDKTRWTKNVFTVDSTMTTALNVDTANGQGDWEAISGPTAVQSSQREIWDLAATGTIRRHIRGLLWGGPAYGAVGGYLPQQGLCLAVQKEPTEHRAVILWYDVVFAARWILNVGVWESDLVGTTLSNRYTNASFDGLRRSSTVTDASRTSNVVTLTTSAAHTFIKGDRLNVNLTDNTFDGEFIVASVPSSTTLTYPQTAVDDASGGTGTVEKTCPYWVELDMPDNVTRVLNVRAWPHDTAAIPAWTTYDDDASIDCPGTSGNYAWTADHADFDIVGDVELWCDFTPDDSTPAAAQSLVGKYGTSNPSNQRSYRMRLDTGGTITVQTSVSGTATDVTFTSTVAPTYTGGRVAVWAVIDVNNGSGQKTCTFYQAATAKDRSSRTQLGTTVTQAGTTSIFSGTARLELGAVNTGAVELYAGLIHAAGVINTAGTTVADVHIPNHQNGSTSFTDRAGKSWTVAGTAVLINTGWPSGTVSALSLDIDELGSAAERTAIPSPTSGNAGVLVAHLGTDDVSRVVYGQVTVGTFSDVPGLGSLSGGGSLSATGIVVELGTAALAGGGSLVVAGQRGVTGTSALVGVGTLTVAGQHGVTGAAAISGIGTLTVSGQRTTTGTAALSGGGTLTVAGLHNVSGMAALSGTGSLTVAGQRTTTGTAALTGVGTLTVAGQHTVSGTAALVGTGTLTVVGQHGVNGTAAITATGTLTASGTRTGPATSALVGVGTLTVSGQRAVSGSAALPGTGTLTALGTGGSTASAALVGVGTLAAAGTRGTAGSGALTGTATLTVAGSRGVRGVAALTGAGTLTAVGQRAVSGTAVLSDSGFRTVAGARTVAGLAALIGVGTITATGTTADVTVAPFAVGFREDAVPTYREDIRPTYREPSFATTYREGTT